MNGGNKRIPSEIKEQFTKQWLTTGRWRIAAIFLRLSIWISVRLGRLVYLSFFSLFFFFNILQWQVTILWSHWCSLFGTSLDPAHGFQSQGGSIIICTLFLLVHNDSQSQLWIPWPQPGPNFTPWYGDTTAGVTAQCHFWDGCQIQTHDLAAQIPTLYWLSYPSWQ